MVDPDPKTLKSALSELRDVNKDKRRTAVMKLGMLGGDEAIRALMRTVEDPGEDLIARGRAALMLGKLGDSRAVDPLIRALKAPGFQTPVYAAEALGLLGDSRAIIPLVALSTRARGKTQEAVTAALERLGYDVAETPEPEPEPEPEPNG